ncbi:MAG: PKD domain-containing protein [Flavobacteriaceae bacterium]
MKNKVKFFHKITLVLATGIFAVGCVGTDLFRDDLPDANSKVDTVFPEANFDYTADQDLFTIIYFTDLSTEANIYLWDFGGGVTSDKRDPQHTFDREGTYPVTLTASDANGESSTITLDVEVVDELVAAFDCPDFLCDPRTPWGGGRGTSTFSGSSDPAPPEGNGGAKISSSSQFLDQTIRVVADAQYEIKFWYVSKTTGSSAGQLLIEDGDTGDDFLSQDVPLTSQASAYVEYSVRFATGENTENMRFNIEYDGTECRYSKISIDRID